MFQETLFGIAGVSNKPLPMSFVALFFKKHSSYTSGKDSNE